MGRNTIKPQPLIVEVDGNCVVIPDSDSTSSCGSINPLPPHTIDKDDQNCVVIPDSESISSLDAINALLPPTVDKDDTNSVVIADQEDSINLPLTCTGSLVKDFLILDSESEIDGDANCGVSITNEESDTSECSDTSSDSSINYSPAYGETIESQAGEPLIVPPSNNVKEGLDLKINDVLRTPLNNFTVIEFLGSGTFGNVIKCSNKSTGKLVAIKLLKVNSRFTTEGDREVKLLRQLNESNSDEHNIVRFLENFEYQTHKCLVFEAMEKSLRDHLESTKYKPMALPFVRVIISQLLVALVHLTNLGILHTDIKPDNIMIVDSGLFPHRVKLIDFGSACHSSDINRNQPLIQSLWYRAPEIILGLPFSETIDVWSLGCVMAELVTGTILYRGRSEFDVIRLITQSLGSMSFRFLKLAPKANQFFVPYNLCGTKFIAWRLKTRQELEPEVKFDESKTYTIDSLNSLVMSNASSNDLFPDDVQGETKDREALFDILEDMLMVNQGARVTALAALDHPFFTLSHLSEGTYADRCAYSRLAQTNAQGPKRAPVVGLESACATRKRSFESDLDISSSPPIKRQNAEQTPSQ